MTELPPPPYQTVVNQTGALLAEEDPKLTAFDPEDFIDRWEKTHYDVTIKKWYLEAWEVFKLEWPVFVALLIVYIGLWWVPVIGGFLAAIPGISFQVYGLHVIRYHESKGEPLFSTKTLAAGVLFYLPMLLLWFLWIIAIAIGLLLLILPGLFLLFTCLFSGPLLLEYYDDFITFFNTMKMSVRVVVKQFWWLVAFQILTFLLAISGVLLLGVGLLITIPVAELSVLVAFKDIFGLNPHRKPDDTCYYLCGKSSC